MITKILLFSSNIAWNLRVKKVFAKNQNLIVIFWGHLGLGDQISAAIAIETLSKQCAKLIIPCKSRNYDCVAKLYGRWKNIEVVEIDNDPNIESNEIYRLQRIYKAKVLFAGHSLLIFAKFVYPGASLNEWLNLCAGVKYGNLVSFKLRETLLQFDQFPIPNLPYALIDHHPDSEREISQEVLSQIYSRGLNLVLNPREVPLYSLLSLMDNATELHMVASAPLCLALATETKAQSKYYYRTVGQGNLNSPAYRDWIEINTSGVAEYSSYKFSHFRNFCYRFVFANRMIGE